jgi:hypothetical protein
MARTVRWWRRKLFAQRRGPSRRLSVEWLERRACPSTYNYTVIAQTGGGLGLTALGTGPSINDSGQVAFVGTASDGSSGIFVGDGSSVLDVAQAIESPNLYFQPTVQINDSGLIAAVDLDSGSPPSYHLRTWNSATSGYQIDDQAGPGTGYTSFFSTSSISNDGNLVYVGTLTGTNTVALIENGSPIATVPSPQPGLSPVIANGGIVVARLGDNTTDPAENSIELFQPSQSPTVIASYPNFSALGASPGISENGQVVAFYGDLTSVGAANINAAQAADKSVPELLPGEGIFASVSTSQGWMILRIAGEASQPYLNSGETFINANADGVYDSGDTKAISVSGFNPDSPVSVQMTYSGTNSESATIVYTAEDANGNNGVYANRLDLLPSASAPFNAQNPGQFRDNIDTLVCDVGDTITDVGTVASVSIYDAVNSNNQIALQVTTTTGTQAVVRDDSFVPILAVDPESQGDASWASDPYAGGGTVQTGNSAGNPYTIKNSGCTLTALSMALNYAGITTDPEDLNNLLTSTASYGVVTGTSGYGGITGHSVVLGAATKIAAEAAALSTGQPNKIVFTDCGPGNPATDSDSATLTALLSSSRSPVIVAVDPYTDGSVNGNIINWGHYVLVTGVEGNLFTINDPGNAQDTTLNPATEYFQIRGYVRAIAP